LFFGRNKVTYWEKDIALSLDPTVVKLLDALYENIFPIKEIIRLTRLEEPHILDQMFHVDVILKIENGTQLTVQEKVRREDYLHFNDFTLEHYSNVFDDIKGEAFKLCTDLYTYGYINTERTRFRRIYIFRVLPFKLAFMNGAIKGTLHQNEKHSFASFYAFSFDSFQDSWFIYKQIDERARLML